MFSVSTIPVTTNGTPRLGDRVRVQRDEIRHRSKGSWPRFRGRTGTVVEINTDRKRPHRTEYGVIFGRVAPRVDGRGGFNWSGAEPICRFREFELRPVVGRGATQRHAEPCSVIPAIDNGGRQLAVAR